MSLARIDEHCRESLMAMDAYLDRCLSPESEEAAMAHLEQCASCASELQQRKMLRDRLQSAVRNVPAPPFLETRIRANLRSQRRGVAWKPLASVAAALAIFAIGGVAYRFGHFRLTPSLQDSYIVSVSAHLNNVMRVGLSDHIHCSVYRKYPAKAPSMEQFVRNLGPDYSNVIPIVRGAIPSEYQLMLAHRCKYLGRPFVHLALKNGSRVVSLVIADKGQGESFAAGDLVPALQKEGIAIYQTGVQRFQLAAFESRKHLVYVISDLPLQTNLDFMLAMTPELKTFFAKLES